MNTESWPHELAGAAYRDVADAFAPAEVAAMRAAVSTSPHLAGNQLGPRFARSRGFSAIFPHRCRDRAATAFPTFAPYFDRALHPTANAFYLNALVLDPGSSVGPHADTSLSTHAGTRVCAMLVSVLYVSVPPDLRGGELILRERGRKVGHIVPVENTLLWFAGHLTHSVARVRSRDPRISLICEQYRLPPDLLARMPEFAMRSSVG